MQTTIDTAMLIKKIKEGMHRLGINQAELARRANVTRSALTQILSGDRTPSTPVLLQIASVLGVSIDFLLGKAEASQIEDILQNDAIREFVMGFVKLKAIDRQRVLQMIDILLITDAGEE
jgi:transcriptional regulator with XRE-family HTH domain